MHVTQKGTSSPRPRRQIAECKRIHREYSPPPRGIGLGVTESPPSEAAECIDVEGGVADGLLISPLWMLQAIPDQLCMPRLSKAAKYTNETLLASLPTRIHCRSLLVVTQLLPTDGSSHPSPLHPATAPRCFSLPRPVKGRKLLPPPPMQHRLAEDSCAAEPPQKLIWTHLPLLQGARTGSRVKKGG